MKTSCRRFVSIFTLSATSRAVLVGVGLFGIAFALHAQDAGADDPADAPTQRSVRVSEAVELALEGKSGEATAALTGALRHPADSAPGHLELGSLLVRIAFECSGRGNMEAADSAAARALEELGIARKLARSDGRDIAASAWQLEGLVKLEFHGDRDAALASYREAAALAPENTQARLKVERLEAQVSPGDRDEEEVSP